jgi:hypothetical protein
MFLLASGTGEHVAGPESANDAQELQRENSDEKIQRSDQKH